MIHLITNPWLGVKKIQKTNISSTNQITVESAPQIQ